MEDGADTMENGGAEETAAEENGSDAECGGGGKGLDMPGMGGGETNACEPGGAIPAGGGM